MNRCSGQTYYSQLEQHVALDEFYLLVKVVFVAVQVLPVSTDRQHGMSNLKIYIVSIL